MTPRIRVSTISGAQQHGSRRVTSAMLAVVVTLGVYVAVLASPAAPAGADPVIPAITSADSASAITGEPFSFTVTTSGPTAALTLSGALPPTFTFTDNGDGTATIAGNPPADADVGTDDQVTITA